MAVSMFDLYSIGIGPSSSHTIGPMCAARKFLFDLRESGKIKQVKTLTIELYGSLAMTGKGHATDNALMLGLAGYLPESVDPDIVPDFIESVKRDKTINLLGGHRISFDPEKHILFQKGKRLPRHSNAMRFICFDADNHRLEKETYYSIGGGFVQSHSEISYLKDELFEHHVPFPFSTAEELMSHCSKEGMRIDEVMLENEKTWRGEGQINEWLTRIWKVMKNSVRRGIMTEGDLPGGLQVKRRAPSLYHKLIMSEISGTDDHAYFLDWTSLFALAVAEENASGGRIVTAPTNGAAGVIPAILHYYQKFIPSFSEEGVFQFLLTAGAIAILFKRGASISGAEMGCQGEIGVASSMAAAGLTSVLGGSLKQIESAAEIAMEHHLGLTCDPVAGLVQIPCIERNTMGAIKAINASRLAMQRNGEQTVSLDACIAAMKEIGDEMHIKFKETSEGGLASSVMVCIPKC